MNNFIALKTIVVKEVMRFMRIWLQTIFPPIITTVLYLLIFGQLIGERIGPMLNIDYLHFIVPGVILMTVIQNSYANTVASFYLSKFNRSFEELLVAPVSNWVILLGYVIGGIFRGLVVGVSVSIVVSFFVEISVFNVFVLVLTLIMTAILFAVGGFINAIFANSFDDISIVPTFVMMPLIYLGGLFYSIDVLPEFWQTVSLFNPIFYMVDAFRYGFLGVSVVDIYQSLLIVFLMTLSLSIVALLLMDKSTKLKN